MKKRNRKLGPSKPKAEETQEPRAIDGQRNYELQSQAVERLVNAEPGQVPEYSKEELTRYQSYRGFKLPELLKALLIKAWFAGAVCYFILWGLGAYVGGLLDMLFILGIALGMVTDLLTNNVLRFMEKTPGESNRYLLVTHRGMVGFGLNLLFSLVIVVLVFFTYDFINRFLVTITSNPDNVLLGVEPILYGLFCMGFDMLLIGIKRLCAAILRDAKAAARGVAKKDGH